MRDREGGWDGARKGGEGVRDREGEGWRESQTCAAQSFVACMAFFLKGEGRRLQGCAACVSMLGKWCVLCFDRTAGDCPAG